MEERNAASLRTHERNVEHYQGLLRTRLNDVETRFVERRLWEERFAVGMIKFARRRLCSERPID